MMLRVTMLSLLVSVVVSQSGSPLPDIEEALRKRPHYSMFLDLLQTSGLLGDLQAVNELTMFVPTNVALSRISIDDYNNLKNDMNDLKMFIHYHCTQDEAWHTDGKSNDKVLDSLANGLPIRLNVYYTLHTYAADGCNITERNIKISNGYIQGIDDVMRIPEGDVVNVIDDHPELTIMSKLVADSGLDAILRADKNITVFAPMNEAFDDMDPTVLNYLQQNPNLVKEVLLYHVVQKTTLFRIGMRHTMSFQTSDSHRDQLVLLEGGDDGDAFFLNGAMLDETDIPATNGVIHTIEQVLLPPSVLVHLEDQGFGHLLVGR